MEQWLPLAQKHNLEFLQWLDRLFIEDREEAEQLTRELRFVERLLREPGHGGIPEEWAKYMLNALSWILPALDGALAEWENVEQLSL